MKKVLGAIFGLVFLVVLAWTGYVLFQKSRKKPVVYTTATAVRTDIVQKTVATGSVVPRKEVAIKPLVPGIVDELYIEEGKPVVKGQLVARVRVIPDMSRLSDAESRLNRAGIELADAEREHGRQMRLFEEGTVSRSELDRAQVALDQAKEELAAAKNTLDIVRSGTSERVADLATTLVRSTISLSRVRRVRRCRS